MIIGGILIYSMNNSKYPPKDITPSPQTQSSSSSSSFLTSSQASVPLPRDIDIINNFFALIDEGKASDAVMMMPSKITRDDSIKQAFGVQFAAMDSVKVKKIEESSRLDWTDTWHQYMVTIDVVMDPNSSDGPIPYYGFERGDNVRFVGLLKEGGVWKVEGMATGQ